MGTVRQDRANLLNASRSTGPKSVEGKERSRLNALQHGLSGSGVAQLPDEADAVARRAAEWNSSLRPFDAYEVWLVEQIALESLRIEKCQELERSLNARSAERAALCWEEDRRLAVETLASRLKAQPALVRCQLRQSRQGCEWLIARWGALGAILLEGRTWDEAQRALALDLLGTPPELRTGATVLDVPAGSDALEAHRALVRDEIAGLERLKAAALDSLDADERTAAAMGLPAEPDRATALARRYEAACMRRLQWAIKQLRSGRHASSPPPLLDRTEDPICSPAPAPVAPACPRFEARAVEAPPLGTEPARAVFASEVAVAAEAKIEVEAKVEAEIEAEAPVEAQPEVEDVLLPGPAPLGPAPTASPRGLVPASVGSAARVPGNRRARRAAVAKLRRARR